MRGFTVRGLCVFNPGRRDFDGDGTPDIAVFRPTSGLWVVRDVTRVYFGGSSDEAVPGDYSGNGRNNFAVYRSSTGLWAVRNFTRAYFGSSGALPVPAGRTEPKGLIRSGVTFSVQSGDDGEYRAGHAFSYQTEAPNPSAPDPLLPQHQGGCWSVLLVQQPKQLQPDRSSRVLLTHRLPLTVLQLTERQ